MRRRLLQRRRACARTKISLRPCGDYHQTGPSYSDFSIPKPLYYRRPEARKRFSSISTGCDRPTTTSRRRHRTGVAAARHAIIRLQTARHSRQRPRNTGEAAGISHHLPGAISYATLADQPRETGGQAVQSSLSSGPPVTHLRSATPPSAKCRGAVEANLHRTCRLHQTTPAAAAPAAVSPPPPRSQTRPLSTHLQERGELPRPSPRFALAPC